LDRSYETRGFRIRAVIYTAISNGKDNLLSQPSQTFDHSLVAFTPNPQNKHSWEIRPLPYKHSKSVLEAKYAKILPHKLFPDYDVSIWIDGNCQILSELSPILEDLEKLKIFFHCDGRDCLYKEANVVKQIRYDNPQIVDKQMAYYRQDGYPENNGLISGGVIIRRHHDPEVIELMEAWWQQVIQFSVRDQLSFNYVAWKQNFPVTYIPGNLRNNHYFQILAHRK